MGDKVTKDFFHVAGPKNLNLPIKFLQRQDGSLTNDPQELRAIATDFYRNLLSTETSSPMSEALRQKVWATISTNVTSEMNHILDAPFGMDEIMLALTAIPTYLCPGLDGLPSSFFLKYWEVIGVDILSAIQAMYDSGDMPDSVSEGLIFLIPKGSGPSSDVSK